MSRSFLSEGARNWGEPQALPSVAEKRGHLLILADSLYTLKALLSPVHNPYQSMNASPYLFNIALATLVNESLKPFGGLGVVPVFHTVGIELCVRP